MWDTFETLVRTSWAGRSLIYLICQFIHITYIHINIKQSSHFFLKLTVVQPDTDWFYTTSSTILSSLWLWLVIQYFILCAMDKVSFS